MRRQAVRKTVAVGACSGSRIPRHRSTWATRDFRFAKAYALCIDDAVIGAAFYIMSMEEGRVFWDPTLPSQTREARRAIFNSKIETLAKLHGYDPQADRPRVISASPAIISRVRSIAGPSNTALPRRNRFPKSKG